MGRPGKQIVASAEQRLLLERLLKNRTQPAALYLRIQLVLQCMEGKSLGEIAAQNKVTSKTVSWWRDRYIAHGLDGLRDKPRSGRPRQYTAAFQETILGKLEEQPPAGHAVWTGSLLAQATGYSKHAIWRFLRAQRIALARRRCWCISTVPEFAAKAADVVGLYLTPPENALVLCVDEKPKIQALERRCGYAVSSDGRLVQGLESTYKRHGTLNLFAALEVATGRIHARTTPSSEKSKGGFLSFLESVLAGFPESDAMEYHVIMDNHSLHKRHEKWLAAPPNVFFHYTPPSASWLNMEEIRFGILRLKSLRGASFTDTAQLAEQIMAFQKAYNETAQPFVWKKREIRGAQLSSSVRNFRN